VISIIPLIDRAFFRDKLTAEEVEVKEDIILVTIMPRVRFKVSWGKYLSRLNTLIVFYE
jgi:hypothetical protein